MGAGNRLTKQIVNAGNSLPSSSKRNAAAGQDLLQLGFPDLDVSDLLLSFPCIFDELDLHDPVTDFFN
jgi:hypothetical protein